MDDTYICSWAGVEVRASDKEVKDVNEDERSWRPATKIEYEGERKKEEGVLY